jgi:hypothetical protein
MSELSRADIERLGTETKHAFIEALPNIVSEYINAVRISDDPETMRKAAELGFRVHGGIIEEKKATSNLPTVNVVIDMTRGTVQLTQSEAADPQDIIELNEAFDALDSQRAQARSDEATDFLKLLPA